MSLAGLGTAYASYRGFGAIVEHNEERRLHGPSRPPGSDGKSKSENLADLGKMIGLIGLGVAGVALAVATPATRSPAAGSAAAIVGSLAGIGLLSYEIAGRPLER